MQEKIGILADGDLLSSTNNSLTTENTIEFLVLTQNLI